MHKGYFQKKKKKYLKHTNVIISIERYLPDLMILKIACGFISLNAEGFRANICSTEPSHSARKRSSWSSQILSATSTKDLTLNETK